MLHRVLCPSLVGRDDELFLLEDAARLQTAAAAGEIVLSDEAHRRVADWLEQRGLEAVPESVDSKGFDPCQRAWRLAAGVQP